MVEAAEWVRLACYYLLGAFSILQAARHWLFHQRHASLLHFLPGVFFITCGHAVLTHNPHLSTYFMTPLLVVWLVVVLFFMRRLARA